MSIQASGHAPGHEPAKTEAEPVQTQRNHLFLILNLVLALLAAVLFWASTTRAAHAASSVDGADALRARLGLQAYTGAGRLGSVKVAVLDNGFDGYEAGKGLLPESAEMPKLSEIAPLPTRHGLGMAQVLWAATGNRPEGPKFYLLNTNGYTNFKAAIDFVIRERVDIVLYAQVWPFGTNFDGTGFLNEQVGRAVRAGALWVNAAGNFGGLVHNGHILRLREPLRFEVKLDETDLALTLSWNDFAETENHNTAKDLDLLVYDEAGKLLGSGELIQRGEAPPETGETRLSSHARESVILRGLSRGKYTVRVRVQSGRFEEKDRYRLLINTEKPIEFPDATRDGELMAPADHPLVISVGDRGELSSAGPTADGRKGPSVLVSDSSVTFTNGSRTAGTSNAAAMIAGAVALLKAEQAGLGFENLRRYLIRLPAAGPDTGNGGTGPDADLTWATLSDADAWTRSLIPAGGKLMRSRTRGHLVILTTGDPLTLPQLRGQGLTRRQPDDVILADPRTRRFSVLARNASHLIPAGGVELRWKAVQPGGGTPGAGNPGGGSGGTPGGGSPGGTVPVSGAPLWKTPTQAELARLVGAAGPL